MEEQLRDFMARPLRLRTPVEDVLRRALALPDRDQEIVLIALAEYRGADDGFVLVSDEDSRLRADAADALDQVGAHLGLEKVSLLAARDFDAAASELGLDWSRSKITRLFGKWSTALAFADGGTAPRTATQKTLRAALIGRARTAEEHFAAIRKWLASSPMRKLRVDYETWARGHNANLTPGDVPVPMPGSISSALGLSFQLALNVADGTMTFEEALERQAARRTTVGHGPVDDQVSEFVSVSDIANLYGVGVNSADGKTKKPAFPVPALKLGGLRVWLRADVEAHVRGEPVPKRKPFFLQHEYYGMREVSELIGLGPQSIHHRDCLQPKCAGKVAGKLYWLRKGVEKWIMDNQELVDERLSGELRGRPRARL